MDLAHHSRYRTTCRLLVLLLLLEAAPARAEMPGAPATPVSPPGGTPTVQDYKRFEGEIPQQPSAPPKITQPLGTQTFRCDRLYIFEGKTLPCDSFVRKDAENLRPIFKDTPAAIEELNEYQRQRRNIRNLAYVTSAGILVAIAGLFVSRPAFSESEIRPGGYMILSGLGLSAGSFIYSLSLTRTNELHLGRAVDIYNQAHPDNPIVLQFSTSIGF